MIPLASYPSPRNIPGVIDGIAPSHLILTGGLAFVQRVVFGVVARPIFGDIVVFTAFGWRGSDGQTGEVKVVREQVGGDTGWSSPGIELFAPQFDVRFGANLSPPVSAVSCPHI